MSPRLLILSYLRCALAGGLEGEWVGGGFGCLAFQLGQLGPSCNCNIRKRNGRHGLWPGDQTNKQTTVTNPRKRRPTDQQKRTIAMLAEEHGATKKARFAN